MGWYEARWGIEEYFRVLKNGTRIEDRLRSHRGRTTPCVKCLTCDAMIEPGRVCFVNCYARDAADTPAAEVLTDDERQVIRTVVLYAERLLPAADHDKEFAPGISAVPYECCRRAWPSWRSTRRR